MKNHFIIKLITGEFVYGRVSKDEINNNLLIVNYPLTWEEYINEDGTVSTTMIKFCNGTDEEDLPLQSSHIVTMAKMSDSFAAFYESAVSLSKMMDGSYDKKLNIMTNRMQNVISQHYAIAKQKETGDLVSYTILPDVDSDSDTTYH